jgi:hypothetical protein
VGTVNALLQRGVIISEKAMKRKVFGRKSESFFNLLVFSAATEENAAKTARELADAIKSLLLLRKRSVQNLNKPKKANGLSRNED